MNEKFKFLNDYQTNIKKANAMRRNVKFKFKFLGLLALMIVLQVPGFAKEYKSKTISKTLDAKPNMYVLHKYGPLQIEGSTDGKVHFEATLTFDASSEADANKVFEHFDIRVGEAGNEIVLETDFDVRSWNQSFGTITLKFNDGDKVKNISKLKINMVVKIPKIEYLKLKNKYDKIKVFNSLDHDLEVELYEGQLNTKNVMGKLNLALKYSQADIGNFDQAKVELYECSLNMGNGKQANINSKYSRWTLGSTHSLIVDAYEGKGEAGLIKGHLELNSKYFRFTATEFGTANISTYEGCFTAQKGKSVKGQNKYGCINIDHIGDIDLESAYETDVNASSIGNLTVQNGKYSNFKTDKLEGGINANTYEGFIKVGAVGEGFSGIEFESKYTNLEVRIPASVKYRLEADLTYPDIDYPEDRFDTRTYIEKNSKVTINGKIKGASDNSPLIKIKAYEGNIELE
jgi:hypothetical protein